MGLKELYLHVGGDYERAIFSFRREEMLHKFLLKYMEDSSYEKLCQAVEAGNTKAAFEASHTLKGTTGMFFLTRLYEAVSELTDQLRPCTEPASEELFQRVKEERMRLEEAAALLE